MNDIFHSPVIKFHYYSPKKITITIKYSGVSSKGERIMFNLPFPEFHGVTCRHSELSSEFDGVTCRHPELFSSKFHGVACRHPELFFFSEFHGVTCRHPELWFFSEFHGVTCRHPELCSLPKSQHSNNSERLFSQQQCSEYTQRIHQNYKATSNPLKFKWKFPKIFSKKLASNH